MVVIFRFALFDLQKKLLNNTYFKFISIMFFTIVGIIATSLFGLYVLYKLFQMFTNLRTMTQIALQKNSKAFDYFQEAKLAEHTGDSEKALEYYKKAQYLYVNFEKATMLGNSLELERTMSSIDRSIAELNNKSKSEKE